MVRGEDRMSDLEALFWGLESLDARLASNMTLVAIFDRPIDRRRAARRIGSLTLRVPRLRHRAVAGVLPMVPPRWEPVADFDLGRHVHWKRSEAGGTVEDLLDIAASMISSPLDRSRPPWEIAFFDGFQGDRAGMIARLHHSYTDGAGALQLAAELFDFEPEGRERRPPPPDPLPQDAPSDLSRLRDDISFEMGRSRQVAQEMLPWVAGSVLDAVRRPSERAVAARAVASSIAQVARAGMSPGSNVMATRSSATRVGLLDLDLGEMKDAGRHAGGTVNDVFLAGLLGGMRLYHAKHGSSIPSIRLGIPVSTRVGDEDVLGNRIEALLLRGPMALADPLERIRLIHELVVSGRSQPVLGLTPHAISAALRLPMMGEVLRRALTSVDVMASNLPGSPVPLFLGGARVERLAPIGPRGGSALNLTLLSYCDRVSIGVNIDAAAIPDHGVVMDCLRAGFDETLAGWAGQ